jgi:hypothetical protein
MGSMTVFVGLSIFCRVGSRLSRFETDWPSKLAQNGLNGIKTGYTSPVAMQAGLESGGERLADEG